MKSVREFSFKIDSIIFLSNTHSLTLYGPVERIRHIFKKNRALYGSSIINELGIHLSVYDFNSGHKDLKIAMKLSDLNYIARID